MPELPEVETTLRGIKPHIAKQKVLGVLIRQPRLRWPIPADLTAQLPGQILQRLWRRGKYLLFGFETGTMILHLGMSGRLHVHTQVTPPQKHDHVDIYFDNNKYLRLTDPRRFGAVLWTNEAVTQHPLLQAMGPEPLTAAFDEHYLWKQAQGKKLPVKSFIMDNKIVVGVGNIYAAEALFRARIRPQTPAGKLSLAQYRKLTAAIKAVLTEAIKKEGTTLKDFMKPSGKPGDFQFELSVYGRGGEPCKRCKTKLTAIKIGQRSTVYCRQCQP